MTSRFPPPPPPVPPRRTPSVSQHSTPTSPPQPPQSPSQHSLSGLPHLYDVAYDQCQGGLESMDRLRSLLEKSASTMTDYATTATKSIDTKINKNRKHSDLVATVAAAHNVIAESIKSSYNIHILTAKKLMTEVVVPLREAHDSGTAKLNELAKQHRALEKETSTASAAVQTELENAQRLLLLAQQQADEGKQFKAGGSSAAGPSAAKSGGIFGRLQKGFESMTLSTPAAVNERIYNTAKKYSSAIDTANRVQTQYLSVGLPTILSQFEQCERSRLGHMQSAMSKWASIMAQALPEQQAVVTALPQHIDAINAPTDFSAVVEEWIKQKGPAPSPTNYVYALPCTPEDIKEGRYQPKPNSVYRTTLEHVMTLQQSRGDTSPIPKLLDVCIQRIRGTDGLTSEGIFRLSTSKTTLDAVREQLDSDDYVLTCDAITAAAAIKDWLRLLSQPLVPLYDRAIQCAREHSEGDSLDVARHSLSVYADLPPINQSVVKAISALCADIVSPANHELNKMTFESLGIVFAPCMLRCESTDPGVIFSNTRYETRFATMLLHAVSASQ